MAERKLSFVPPLSPSTFELWCSVLCSGGAVAGGGWAGHGSARGHRRDPCPAAPAAGSPLQELPLRHTCAHACLFVCRANLLCVQRLGVRPGAPVPQGLLRLLSRAPAPVSPGAAGAPRALLPFPSRPRLPLQHLGVSGAPPAAKEDGTRRSSPQQHRDLSRCLPAGLPFQCPRERRRHHGCSAPSPETSPWGLCHVKVVGLGQPQPCGKGRETSHPCAQSCAHCAQSQAHLAAGMGSSRTGTYRGKKQACY